MAAARRPLLMVNNSSLVALGQRRRLAGRRRKGHSAGKPRYGIIETNAPRIPRVGSGPREPRILEDLPMSDAVKVGFVPLSAAARGMLVAFCDEHLKFGAATLKALGTAADTVKRAAAANRFKGKSGSTLDILAPEGIKAPRLIVVGTGKSSELKEKDFLKFGGIIAGKLNAGSDAVTVIAELSDAAMTSDAAA